jgi:hypothetical protein
MKTFFKFVFASMLGVILSSILMFFLLIGIVSVMVSSGSEKKIKVEKGSILHIDLSRSSRTVPTTILSRILILHQWSRVRR